MQDKTTDAPNGVDKHSAKDKTEDHPVPPEIGRPSLSSTPAPRLRLEFLDGMRGLAALYVVIGHACAMVNYALNVQYSALLTSAGNLPHPALSLAHALEFGHYSVVVFIVLSGYCLMLPVARSANGAIKGGVWEYLKRRARRILPPYYTALILSLLLIALVPGMRHPSHSFWSISLPVFTRGVLVSHLLLIHNLRPDWMFKIDSPMWSVGTEWQIYFIFPLLLFVWRRFGTAAMVVIGVALGMAIHTVTHHRFDQAAPWFVGAFTLGMAGASINFSTQPQENALHNRVIWSVLSVLSLGLLTFLIRHPQVTGDRPWLLDTVAAVGAMGLLIWCTLFATGTSSSRTPILLRLFNSRWAVMLGTFSYSLYLVHFPVLGAMDLVFRSLHFSSLERLIAQLGIAVPASVLLAYLFHLAFERRFMPGHPHTQRQVVAATVREPAI